MTHFACGLWPANRGHGLVAVVVDENGHASPKATIASTPDAAWALLTWLDGFVGLDCDLVLPDWLATSCDLARLALERGGVIWLVPGSTLSAVRLVANLNTGPPARTATALARLPLAPAFRPLLRRLSPPQTPQLPLF